MPRSSRGRAQLLVHEERLGAVALAVERLHQNAVAGLAVRLAGDEPPTRAHRGRELRAADAERGARVRLERANVQAVEVPAFLVHPGRVLARQERPGRDEHGDLRRRPGGVRIGLRERGLGAVERVGGRLDVDPVGAEPQPVELDEPPQLRQQRRQAAVAAARPQGLDRLLARDRAQAVGGEEREEQATLPPGQTVLGAPAVDREREPAAELDSRRRQAGAKIAPTPTAYNRGNDETRRR
jgi:hypothetical protein